jgi:hypothetical protein
MVPRLVLFSVLSSSTRLWFVDVEVWNITNMRVANHKTNELLNFFFLFSFLQFCDVCKMVITHKKI